MAADLDVAPAGEIAIGELRVQRLGFGAMRISNARGADGTPDAELGRQLVRRAVERGVTFIDTANIYGLGRSEELIAEALWPYPSDLVVATKSGYEMRGLLPGERRLPARGRPEHLKAECETSLRRLQLERIDLYLLHTPDPAVPYADSVGALVDLRHEGKIRHIGLSNVTSDQLAEAMRICQISAVQNRYNAGDREGEPVLRMCEQAGVAFVPWQPIVRDDGHRRAAVAIAAAHGVTEQQVSLAWLLRRSPVMLPIPGTTKLAHLDANIDAAWVQLSDDEFDLLGATV
jgi:pyridoxine 4-dehydrogenase